MFDSSSHLATAPSWFKWYLSIARVNARGEGLEFCTLIHASTFQGVCGTYRWKRAFVSSGKSLTKGDTGVLIHCAMPMYGPCRREDGLGIERTRLEEGGQLHSFGGRGTIASITGGPEHSGGQTPVVSPSAHTSDILDSQKKSARTFAASHLPIQRLAPC